MNCQTLGLQKKTEGMVGKERAQLSRDLVRQTQASWESRIRGERNVHSPSTKAVLGKGSPEDAQPHFICPEKPAKGLQLVRCASYTNRCHLDGTG